MQIKHYRLLKQIGQGVLSKIFLAVDESKSPATLCVIQQLCLQNQTLDALVQKAHRLQELSKHPQIPALLAYFQQDNNFYLVQEFIEGTNLASLMAEVGAFGETQIWQLLENILPVIQYIHDRNIIHGDIKPENIILRASPPTQSLVIGELVLVGFSNVISESPIGSPEYAAPEQVKEKPVFASDLYSLGVTCIYLLTQIPPFDLFDITSDSWVWQHYLTIKVSERLSKILNKLVQKDISQRFQSAYEVMQDLGIHSPPLHTPSSHIPWRCLHTLTPHSGMSSGINSIAINSEGNILASGHDDKTIKLWDLNTKQLMYTLTGHSLAVKCVAFSPDQKILASGSDDKTIKLWNLNTQEEICTLGHSKAVKSVAFSPSAAIDKTPVLASGSWDKTVKLWDVQTFQEICTLTGHQLQVSAVAFSPQGQLLATASLDRNIRLWYGDLKCPHYTLSGILSGHAWAVLAIAFSPNGKILATGSDDNTIKLWDVDTGQVIGNLLGHSWSVVSVAFSVDGEMLISGSRDKTIKIWRVSTKEEIATLHGHVDSVSAVAVSPVAQLIASGSRDKTIKLWEFVQQQKC